MIVSIFCDRAGTSDEQNGRGVAAPLRACPGGSEGCTVQCASTLPSQADLPGLPEKPTASVTPGPSGRHEISNVYLRPHHLSDLTFRRGSLSKHNGHVPPLPIKAVRNRETYCIQRSRKKDHLEKQF